MAWLQRDSGGRVGGGGMEFVLLGGVELCAGLACMPIIDDGLGMV